MRRFLKNSILEIFKTIYEAHKIIRNYIKEYNFENAKKVLIDCQASALEIGKIIENSEGKGFVTVGILEEYCKYVYQIFMNINEECNGKEIKEELDKRLNKVEKSVKDDIKVKLEIVFLPYKASMWDSFESIWKAADEDPDCDAYVVPIPYYDRNHDHSFGQLHYEGYDYPDYVPITDYRKYDIKNRKPDVVYIHNPYDDCNYVTSVHPDYYSRELKKYTDMLVYVPYFIQVAAGSRDFVNNPGVLNSDYVILPDEDTRKVYAQVYNEIISGSESKYKKADEKFLSLGSPKVDKVLCLERNKDSLPNEWKQLIYKFDGTRKKVIFYNTSLSALLMDSEAMIKKITSVISFFENRDDVVLWWRPHPLYVSTLQSMRPELYNEYMGIVERYKKSGHGIFDESSDLYMALAEEDAYYGDLSSLVVLCKARRIPIMIQNPNMSADESAEHLLSCSAVCYINGSLWFAADHCNGLFRCDMESRVTEKIAEFPDEYPFAQYLYSQAVSYKNKIVFIPRNARSICIYDISENAFHIIRLKKECFGAVSFCSALMSNTLYIIPYMYPAVIKLNIDDYSVKYIEDCISFKNAAPPFFGRQCITIGKYIYIPCFFTNGILRLNTETDKADMIRIGASNMSYFGIAHDKEIVYISFNNGNGIIKWNVKNNKCVILPYSEDKKFLNLYISDDKLIALAHHNEPVYEYSLENNVLSKKNMKCYNGFFVIFPEYRNYFYDDENNFYYISSRTGCVHHIEDDSIVIKLKCDKTYEDFGLINSNVKPSHHLYENDIYSLDELLKIVDECIDNGSVIDYANNVYQLCGNVIHNRIIKKKREKDNENSCCDSSKSRIKRNTK